MAKPATSVIPATRGARIALAAFLALAVAVPAVAVAELPIIKAQPTLKLLPLTLVTSTGRHRYSVELAATPLQQEVGLMFRTKMARNHGMLFPFDPPRPATFWMENTVLPLDLVFIGADGHVLNVAANAKSYSRDLIPSAGPAAAVLELGAGEAARVRLKAGDAVIYRLPG